MLSLDSKLLRTLRPLISRPGFLTKAYLAGKRVRYVNPLRLYLVCSLAFFLMIAIFPGEERIIRTSPSSSSQQSNANAIAELPDSTIAGSADSVLAVMGTAKSGGVVVANDLRVLRALRNKQVDIDAVRRIQEIYAAAGVDSIWTPSDSLVAIATPADSLDQDEFDQFWAPFADRVDGGGINIGGLESVPLFGSRLQNRLDWINRTDGDDLSDLFDKTMIRHLPKAVFVLVPLFALVMKVLYRRRSKMYTEHLIFALHLHAFGFLLLLLIHLMPWDIAKAVLFCVLLIYLYRATRAVYEQGHRKTLVKLAAVSGSYFFFLILSMLGAAIAAVLTM